MDEWLLELDKVEVVSGWTTSILNTANRIGKYLAVALMALAIVNAIDLDFSMPLVVYLGMNVVRAAYGYEARQSWIWRRVSH